MSDLQGQGAWKTTSLNISCRDVDIFDRSGQEYYFHDLMLKIFSMNVELNAYQTQVISSSAMLYIKIIVLQKEMEKRIIVAIFIK